jgi:hypothetical protein
MIIDADELYAFLIFGVNGGDTNLSGQSERPVRTARSGGNGIVMPDPFLG